MRQKQLKVSVVSSGGFQHEFSEENLLHIILKTIYFAKLSYQKAKVLASTSTSTSTGTVLYW
jgi:hypothetical protein